MTEQHGLWAFYQGHRHFSGLTALNRRTTAAYDRCVAAGGHRASGDYALRDFGSTQHNLSICRNCSVPFGGPRRFATWTIK